MVVRIFAAALLAVSLLASGARADDETVTVQLVKSTGSRLTISRSGKGYFAKEGIKIDAGNVRSALDTIGPMATGRLDAAWARRPPAFSTPPHQGFDLRIVAAMGMQGPLMATQPLARKELWDNGTIRSAQGSERPQGRDQRARRHHRIFPDPDPPEIRNGAEGRRADADGIRATTRRLQERRD